MRNDADWQRVAADAQRADFIFGSMLFGEEYVRPLQRMLAGVSAPVCVITSNPALIRMTRLGGLSLAKREEEQAPSALQQWARKFRPRGGHGEGQRQLAMLRNLGKILKHIPGKARDLHTYIAVHQYWMHCSPENLRRMLCMLIERYVPGYQGKLPFSEPIAYPDTALLHPEAEAPFADTASFQRWRRARPGGRQAPRGVVGLLSLRTVALSGNTAHLDALVAALEKRGLEVRLAYGANLDFRPTIDTFFRTAQPQPKRGLFGRAAPAPAAPAATEIDLLINGAGFSLIGGMAESRPDEARTALEQLDVAYLDMIPLAFQRVEEWQKDDTGLTPIQVAMNVAVPELDSATEPLVYGGPTDGSDRFVALPAEIERAAERIARRVALNRTPNAQKKIATVLFNFPPTLGNVGTAAYLDVFASLHRFMLRLAAEGYDIAVPASVEELRAALVEGNSGDYGTDGNLAARLPVGEYMRLFPHYAGIEPFWGRAPGELLNDGLDFFVLGKQFGNLFVGIQPSFGYERDPMRLLMAKDAAPHHGFAAFYTWIDRVFGADAVVHFGTHGALEFMPGKQVGMSSDCWPSRLLGGMPNFYYYSVNNPSEATIAKRRGAATLVSYMVPPLQQAGLYRGLRLLRDSIDTYRAAPSPELLADIRAQAERLGITIECDHAVRPKHAPATPLSHASPTTGASFGPTHDHASPPDAESYIAALAHELILVEQRMIPIGLHVLGTEPAAAELADMLALVATFVQPDQHLKPLPRMVAAALGADYDELRDRLRSDRMAQERWEQIDRIVRGAVTLLSEKREQPLAERAAAADAYLQETIGIRPGTLARLWAYLDDLLTKMIEDQELNGLMRGLSGGYIPPSPGNDVVRNPAVVPTGRNIHGLDPFRVPTPAAQDAGWRLMRELVERLTREQGAMPESIAMVLWGTDNLKSDGEGVAQALALIGARVVVDELGKVSDVALVPLSELQRPRIDAVVTVSGIFRDLLSHQMTLIAKAVHLAAEADEPIEFNFVRKHALAQAQELGVSLADAATRVFSNAPGSYGANVNHLVESGGWNDVSELGEAFVARKSFAFGAQGEWRAARAEMESALATVDATFQNIDSFEVGVSDIDHYYEYLGGVTRSVEQLRGKRPPVIVAEALTTTGRLSSLEQIVRLETRAKLLNPKWFEAMLAHGYQGVHEIEARVGNTYGWSATAEAVEGWVYQGVAETYLLDEAMRERMARLNAHSTVAIARRLLEANHRGFWDADEATLAALQGIYADLEDRLEGVAVAVGG
jgi:magnesium chelatase subunit H